MGNIFVYYKRAYYICTDNKQIYKNQSYFMWSKTHSIVTKEVTREQLWKLYSDIDNWHTWDSGVESARLEGKFEVGSYFQLKPKGGPKVRIQLVEIIPNRKFVDMTRFPLAKMYGEHTFEDTTEGVRMTITMKVEGILAGLWRRIVAQGIVDKLPGEMAHQVRTAAAL
jgi:polyketide cyclase/dehydrase/lipid transport protein